jgi:ubiquinone/menaquinone biosynthesis C-methylase UbiE
MTQLAETLDAPPESAASIFQREWRLYRKIVDHNYIFHHEACTRLRKALVEEATRPFRFLDLACGDAGSIAEALRGVEVASYFGVDLSAEGLRLASQALGELPCPVSLRQGDCVETLATQDEPVDVIWIGLSLHHLRAPAKSKAMRAARKLLDERGMLLVYEHTSPDGEDREGWFRRWELLESDWTALTPEEWRRLAAHVRTYDFPETASGWRALGKEAGFGSVRELFAGPTGLLRLYAFQP